VADLERIRWTGALLKSLLFRTEATEPQTLVAVATVPAVALAASLVPARRAASINPSVSLRDE
jgi:ABC-type lipoprotein release transport system permease subunit